MSKEIEKQYFIPARLIEFQTTPEDTLQDKIARLVRSVETKEEKFTPQVFILKYMFCASDMGYNVIYKITY